MLAVFTLVGLGAVGAALAFIPSILKEYGYGYDQLAGPYGYSDTLGDVIARGIAISPSTVTVKPGQRVKFSATLYDVNGSPIYPQGMLLWTTDEDGLFYLKFLGYAGPSSLGYTKGSTDVIQYKAPTKPGTYTVKVTTGLNLGDLSDTATVIVK